MPAEWPIGRVLLVVADNSLRIDLAEYLEAKSFEVYVAQSAADCIKQLKQATPDVAVVDIALPDGDGIELTTKIRELLGLQCGIVLLTAFSDVHRRLAALSSGADIYLVKTVSLREIELTILGLLRRIKSGGPSPNRTDARAWVLVLDLWEVVSPGGHHIALSATERTLLDLLMRRAGATCTRESLLAAVVEYSRGRREVSLDAIIRRLRKKIHVTSGEVAPIRTVYGCGYVFTSAARVLRGWRA